MSAKREVEAILAEFDDSATLPDIRRRIEALEKPERLAMDFDARDRLASHPVIQQIESLIANIRQYPRPSLMSHAPPAVMLPPYPGAHASAT